ncbi:MAG: F0F1 ATP synthase subunit A [Planctomycetota bacterium]
MRLHNDTTYTPDASEVSPGSVEYWASGPGRIRQEDEAGHEDGDASHEDGTEGHDDEGHDDDQTGDHDEAHDEGGHDEGGHDEGGHDEGGHDEGGHDHEDGDHSHEGGEGHHEGEHDHDGEHGHGIDYLSQEHLFHHVQDSYHVELPRFLGLNVKETNEAGELVDYVDSHGHTIPGIAVPNLTGFTKEEPMFGTRENPWFVGRPTKFMCLEIVAALIITVLFVWLARQIKGGKVAKGRFANLLETFVVFVRDDIVGSTMSKKDANRFLPFLLTLFFFILALNLIGMIPFMGSATGSIAVTGVLAVLTFFVVVGSGIKKMGFIGFLKAQVPGMDLPPALAMILIPALWVIEMFGLFVKHFVLAVRLFANMFAGHLVLAIFLAFIGAVGGSVLVYMVTPLSVIASVALGVLELFVAFLQTYVFVFLASLFIGSAQHAH